MATTTYPSGNITVKPLGDPDYDFARIKAAMNGGTIVVGGDTEIFPGLNDGEELTLSSKKANNDDAEWTFGHTSQTDMTRVVPAQVQRNTAYVLGDVVFNANRVYKCTVAGTTAGSGGPTHSGFGVTAVDGGVTWQCFSYTTSASWVAYKGTLPLSANNAVIWGSVQVRKNGDGDSNYYGGVEVSTPTSGYSRPYHPVFSEILGTLSAIVGDIAFAVPRRGTVNPTYATVGRYNRTTGDFTLALPLSDAAVWFAQTPTPDTFSVSYGYAKTWETVNGITVGEPYTYNYTDPSTGLPVSVQVDGSRQSLSRPNTSVPFTVGSRGCCLRRLRTDRRIKVIGDQNQDGTPKTVVRGVAPIPSFRFMAALGQEAGLFQFVGNGSTPLRLENIKFCDSATGFQSLGLINTSYVGAGGPQPVQSLGDTNALGATSQFIVRRCHFEKLGLPLFGMVYSNYLTDANKEPLPNLVRPGIYNSKFWDCGLAAPYGGEFDLIDNTFGPYNSWTHDGDPYIASIWGNDGTFSAMCYQAGAPTGEPYFNSGECLRCIHANNVFTNKNEDNSYGQLTPFRTTALGIVLGGTTAYRYANQTYGNQFTGIDAAYIIFLGAMGASSASPTGARVFENAVVENTIDDCSGAALVLSSGFWPIFQARANLIKNNSLSGNVISNHRNQGVDIVHPSGTGIPSVWKYGMPMIGLLTLPKTGPSDPGCYITDSHVNGNDCKDSDWLPFGQFPSTMASIVYCGELTEKNLMVIGTGQVPHDLGGPVNFCTDISGPVTRTGTNKWVGFNPNKQEKPVGLELTRFTEIDPNIDPVDGHPYIGV